MGAEEGRAHTDYAQRQDSSVTGIADEETRLSRFKSQVYSLLVR